MEIQNTVKENVKSINVTTNKLTFSQIVLIAKYEKKKQKRFCNNIVT